MTGFPETFNANCDFILSRIEDTKGQKLYKFDSGVVLDYAIVVVAFNDSGDSVAKRKLESKNPTKPKAIDLDNGRIYCTFFPLKYCRSGEDTEWAMSRMAYTNDLFSLWTKAGFNTKKAKDPFKSKEFCKLLFSLFEQEEAEYVEIAIVKPLLPEDWSCR